MLPILQTIVDKIKTTSDLKLEKVTFVCVQHLLFTTVDIIKALISLQAKPSNIHIMGKIYSSCPEVAKQLVDIGITYYPSSIPVQLGCFSDYFIADIIKMWEVISANIVNTNSDTIIILDDGGKAIANFPKALGEHYKVFVVEQTSSGVSYITKNNITLPLINVAYSAAKQLLESPMIARAVIAKLSKFLPTNINDNAICAVVGLGAIGRAVVQLLLSLGHTVIIYDKIVKTYDLLNSCKFTEDLQLLFEEAEYIFGCTGEDITVSLDISKICGVKNFISCSSQDIEFCSLLKIIQNNSNEDREVLKTIEYPLHTPQQRNVGLIRIYKGGYPINLDNTGESVPAKDIQLTRGLLFGGVIQAILQLSSIFETQQYMLHPLIQKLIVRELINNQIEEENLHDSQLIANFLDVEWIKNHSGGKYIDNDVIAKLCFEQP